MSLPILSSQFFDKHTPDLGFFSKWRSFHTWTDQCLPIYEWKEVLYVACLQPPKNFPQTSQKVVFLLCDHESLKQVWYSFEGTVVYSRAPSLNVSPPTIGGQAPRIQIEEAEEQKEKYENKVASQSPAVKLTALDLANENTGEFQIEVSPDIPLEIESEFKLVLNSESTQVENLDSVEIESPALEAAAPSSANVESELKLDFALNSPAMESSDDPLEATVAENTSLETTFEEAPPLIASETKAPPGMSVSATAQAVAPDDNVTALLEDGPSEESAAPAAIEELDTNLLDLTGGSGSPAVAQEKMGSNPLVSLQSTDGAKPAKPDTSELTPIQMDGATGLNAPEKRAAPTKSEPVIFNSDITRHSIQTLNSVPNDKMDPWMQKLFSELGAHYQKSMILLKSGDQVKPWKWDEQFTPATPSVTSVTLLQPSPFRIVHRTHKPFHGYVVPNDLNQKFFAQWNNSQIPEHLTIAPVMIENHVIGMLLAIGPKTADTKACLHLTESLANGIAHQIKSADKAA